MFFLIKDRICDWCRTTLYKFCIQKLHQLGEGKKLSQPKLFMYNTNHKFGHFEGKQSNVEDYPADQVPVVPVLFTVVSWVVDHVLVVVHSCTGEEKKHHKHQHQHCSLLLRRWKKNITNININIDHSCKDKKKHGPLANQVIFWYLCRFHWWKCASLWKISSRRCWKSVNSKEDVSKYILKYIRIYFKVFQNIF